MSQILIIHDGQDYTIPITGNRMAFSGINDYYCMKHVLQDPRNNLQNCFEYARDKTKAPLTMENWKDYFLIASEFKISSVIARIKDYLGTKDVTVWMESLCHTDCGEYMLIYEELLTKKVFTEIVRKLQERFDQFPLWQISRLLAKGISNNIRTMNDELLNEIAKLIGKMFQHNPDAIALVNVLPWNLVSQETITILNDAGIKDTDICRKMPE